MCVAASSTRNNKALKKIFSAPSAQKVKNFLRASREKEISFLEGGGSLEVSVILFGFQFLEGPGTPQIEPKSQKIAKITLSFERSPPSKNEISFSREARRNFFLRALIISATNSLTKVILKSVRLEQFFGFGQNFRKMERRNPGLELGRRDSSTIWRRGGS